MLTFPLRQSRSTRKTGGIIHMCQVTACYDELDGSPPRPQKPSGGDVVEFPTNPRGESGKCLLTAHTQLARSTLSDGQMRKCMLPLAAMLPVLIWADSEGPCRLVRSPYSNPPPTPFLKHDHARIRTRTHPP